MNTSGSSIRLTIRTLAVLTIIVGACAHPPAPAPPKTPDPAIARAAIDSQFDRRMHAYRDKDGSAFAAVYTTDAVSTSPLGVMNGRPAIEAAMTKSLARVESTKGDSAVIEEFVMAADRAVQSGHVIWSEIVKGRPPVPKRVDFVFIWRRDPDAVWRIARELSFGNSGK